MESQEQLAIWFKSQPQPSLLTTHLNPCLIHHEVSNMSHHEEAVQLAEPLNPVPNRNMALWTKILQTRRHSPQTQTLKVHIHHMQRQNQRSPLTLNTWANQACSNECERIPAQGDRADGVLGKDLFVQVTQVIKERS